MIPLTELDLDRLEKYLDARERAEVTLPLDAVQGLFAAIACATLPVAREKWLPAILGDSIERGDKEEIEQIAKLLERFAEDTAYQLNEGEGFDFILYGGEHEDFSSWADGYLAGVDLADPPWDEQVEPEDLDNLLFPFLALTGQAKDLALEAGEEWMSEAEEARMLAEIREDLAGHLIEVRRYWFEKGIPPTVKREGPKVGRNDPCPCGSGRKYKSCHGR
jgi:uncharacterized protein